MRFAMFVMVGLTACAGGSTGTRASQQPSADASDDPDMICRHEARTGSNITHKVCRTRELSERERKAAEDFMMASRPQKQLAH